MSVLCGMTTIQYLAGQAGSTQLYLIAGSLSPPESSVQVHIDHFSHFCRTH